MLEEILQDLKGLSVDMPLLLHLYVPVHTNLQKLPFWDVCLPIMVAVWCSG